MPEPEQAGGKVELPEAPESKPARGLSATVIVSFAAVIVTAFVGILGIVNTRRAQLDEEAKNERDFKLGCVSSAASMARMAYDLWKDFKSLDDNDKIHQVNVIIALFPPDSAKRLLAALSDSTGPAQPVITAFQAAQSNLDDQIQQDQTNEDRRAACQTVKQLLAFNGGTVETQSPPPAAPGQVQSAAPTAAPPSSTSMSTAAPSPPPPGASFAIYYQITQPADLNYAKLLAKDAEGTTEPKAAGTLFQSAGVEVVPAAKPFTQTEIRYYRLDQAAAAEELASQLRNAATAKSLKLEFHTAYIGAAYPNLPTGRMEVWFQRLVLAQDIVSKLTSDDKNTRDLAREELAEKANASQLYELLSEPTYRIQLGAAVALTKMQQPVQGQIRNQLITILRSIVRDSKDQTLDKWAEYALGKLAHTGE